MASLNQKISLYSEKFLFFYACLSCFLIVILGASTFKYSIFALSIFSFLLAFHKINWNDLAKEFKTYILPWLPWTLCVFILIFVHGSRGLTQYINAFLLIALLFLGCTKYDIGRKSLVILLSSVLTILNLAIATFVFKYGLANGVLGVNKNELMAVVAFITLGIACTLFTQSKNYKLAELTLMIIAVVSTLFTTIMTEVRNAILPYGAAFLAVLIFAPKNQKKTCFYFLLIFVGLIICSYLTGRLQTGLEDLKDYQEGHSYSSWGLRLEMWKMVLQGFPQAPLFGWGYGAPDAMEAAGILFPIREWHPGHFHNDFFIALAGGGLTMAVGWIASLVLLIKNSFTDLPRLCCLTSILATGLAEQNWFEQNMLFPFVILWTLFCLTDPARKKAFDYLQR